jgi:glycine oxidase
MRRVGSIIVGQGVAGTMIHYHLMKSGKKAIVFDENTDILNSSSVALGMANPITGRNLVKSWMVEEIFPFARKMYLELEKLLNVSLLTEKEILKLFSSQKEVNQWEIRSTEAGYEQYLSNTELNNYPEVNAPYGYGRINKGFWVDTFVLIGQYRSFLESRNEFDGEKFSYSNLEILSSEVRYKDIVANNIIFCEGYKTASNPFFNYLPVKSNKGEIIDFEMDLDIDEVLNRNGNFVPLKRGYFKMGATFDRDFKTIYPTEEGLSELKEKLDSVINIPYIINNHYAGIRPTSIDRRPILGSHPEYNNIFIFNGMGTKGVTLSPYFSNQLVDHVLTKNRLLETVDIKRFIDLYKKEIY